METEHPDPDRWWRHRRERCDTAMKAAGVETVLLGFLAYFSPEAVSAMTTVVVASYTLWSWPVIGYYSNTAVEEWAKRGGMTK